MRKAQVSVCGIKAGVLEKHNQNHYRFIYETNYQGQPISLTMPTTQTVYEFDRFPSFFEGLLPEGILLEALLRKCKLNKNDYFGQLVQVGQDVVGAVTIEELK